MGNKCSCCPIFSDVDSDDTLSKNSNLAVNGELMFKTNKKIDKKISKTT